MGRDVRPEIGAAVQAHAMAAGRTVGRDLAGVGPETLRRVLSRDPALEGGAVDDDRSPGRCPRSASVAPAATRSWAWTRSTEVTSSVTVCSTWMRGFISMKT